MTDFELGYYLASASDSVLQAVLADRPVALALLRRLNELLPSPTRLGDSDVFFNSEENSNELALATIIAPPRTARRHRSVTRVRLRHMQQELDAGMFPGSITLAEIDVEEEACI